MNAKEKAKEIYCKYAYALNIRDLQTTANPFVKQCALIAVEEILHCEATEPSDTDWDDCGATAQYYWPQKKVDAGKAKKIGTLLQVEFTLMKRILN
jgi:hypothetical protein